MSKRTAHRAQPAETVTSGCRLAIRSSSSSRRWSSSSCSASGSSKTFASPGLHLRTTSTSPSTCSPSRSMRSPSRSRSGCRSPPRSWSSCSPIVVLAIVYVAPPSRHRLLLLLAVAPFWSSYVLRLFSWQILLANKGIIQLGLESLGLENCSQPDLYPDRDAHRPDPLPGADRSSCSSMSRSPTSIATLIQAARDLGATRWQAFPPRHPADEQGRASCWRSFATIVSFGDVLAGTLLGGGAGTRCWAPCRCSRT